MYIIDIYIPCAELSVIFCLIVKMSRPSPKHSSSSSTTSGKQFAPEQSVWVTIYSEGQLLLYESEYSACYKLRHCIQAHAHLSPRSAG